jgi:hypothetical protein
MDSGWFGSPEQVEHVLKTLGADKDEEGRFLLYGEAPFVGLDGDLVVSSKVLYSVSGKRQNLVAALRKTSYGLSVTVL